MLNKKIKKINRHRVHAQVGRGHPKGDVGGEDGAGNGGKPAGHDGVDL